MILPCNKWSLPSNYKTSTELSALPVFAYWMHVCLLEQLNFSTSLVLSNLCIYYFRKADPLTK